jgi:hypothetical protein
MQILTKGKHLYIRDMLSLSFPGRKLYNLGDRAVINLILGKSTPQV